MCSDVVNVAAPGLPRIEASGGLAGRCTATDTVHLICTAATPLGGDAVTIRVVVESGAALRIRTATATVVLPGRHTLQSTAQWDIDVDGQLDLDPQPTLVAGGSTHRSTTRLRIGESVRARIRERVQIGRSGERAGFWSAALHADVGSADRPAPLLRHRVELGCGAVGDDVLATPRACVSELRYPAASFDAEGMVMALARGGSLATWQGDRLPPGKPGVLGHRLL